MMWFFFAVIAVAVLVILFAVAWSVAALTAEVPAEDDASGNEWMMALADEMM